ncbi:hypothetical protein L596_008270 [Steinernema carpocapsae]|uniref:Uncharacterized protein n=1 Tax=Steinernema carpocapsae TaxID=34508 RepID=A0A4U5PC21_STECR|nr:hypothetical protein L596_008270 [Steinernema carpocapsae]
MLETNRPIASIPRDPLTTTLYAVEIVICLFAVVEHLIFIKISYKVGQYLKSEFSVSEYVLFNTVIG